MLVDSQFDEQERLVRETAREFVSDRIVTSIADWYSEGRFPRNLIPELGRMGFLGANLEGWGGPLPQSWIDAHVKLGQQILARERELGMTPILQAFTGHVPKAYRDANPTVRIDQQHIALAANDAFDHQVDGQRGLADSSLGLHDGDDHFDDPGSKPIAFQYLSDIISGIGAISSMEKPGADTSLSQR